MKQEVIKYLITVEEELFNVSKYLYDNPEDSFCEEKAYKYLIHILKKHSFKVTENFLDISTAFIAQFGKGHPKICYICEYDCMCKSGHILGTNLVSSISLGAALGLAKVIPKIGGSVIIIGCPGEFLGGSKVTMAKQGAFSDIDVILMAKPFLANANCCSSPAVLPIKISYYYNNFHNSNLLNKRTNNSILDNCIFILNSIATITKNYKDCLIDRISINSNLLPSIAPNTAEIGFYIKAPNLDTAEQIRNKISNLNSCLKELMDIDSNLILPETPCENFICSNTLSRILSHNLKEIGIINIAEDISVPYGLSLGIVSHMVPSIRYLVKITENTSLKYASEDFAKETISSFAREQVLKAAEALALTGIDLIQKQDLISEAKLELNKNTR